MKKILFNTARASTPDLLAQGGKTLKGLTDNPDFQNPYPPLNDFEAALDSLTLNYSKAQFGSKLTREKFKRERNNFRNMMRQMINYINTVAINNGERCMEIIVEAGFDYNRTANTIPAAGEMTKIEAFMTGREGEILIKSGPSKNARYFEFYISTDAENFTLVKTQQQRNAYINGLESLKKYYFKVRGVNKSGASDFSYVVWMVAA